MSQIFHPSMNTISRATIFGAVFIVAAGVWLLMTVVRSPYVSGVGVIKPQPVPFSHQHHVAEAGIDCRYCHTNVEDSSFAGIPPTQTCMNCHSQLWTESPMLEPVRASFREDEPLVWNRVHDVPDFVMFYHNIHIKRGVACTTCHGQLAEMPLTWKYATLYMEWCLECHRNPERFVGPPEKVFASAGVPMPTISEKVDPHEGLRSGGLLTNCSTCHY
jgi:cytochrome c7-like protein